MKFSIAATAAVLIAVIATLSFVNSRDPGSYSVYPQNGSLEKRIDALEQRLAEEIENREALSVKLDHERTKRMALADRISEIGGLENILHGSINSEGNGNSGGRFSLTPPSSEQQHSLLLDAGFSSYEADKIIEIETEMQQKLINAIASNERINARELALETQTDIRSELGDNQYELYLETTGRPTTVPVARIEEDSAGQVAGLREGDNIISYDGERVFSILDLQRLTQEGTSGQTIIIDIVRDDSPMAIAVPRGQIGISSRGNGRRRDND